MNALIQLVESNLPGGQRAMLERFLDDVQNRRLPGDPDQLRQLLGYAGELLPEPVGDRTLPDVFNMAVRSLLANIAGLYRELDGLERIQDGIADFGRAELDKIELALRDLTSIMAQARRTHAPELQFSDVFFETFGPGTEWERGREWYQPNPTLSETGQVEGFLPAQIDPEDRSLKLALGGDFSRTTSAYGEPLARVSLDELLGVSVDASHPLPQALDGRSDSYWRELILADSPVQCDPDQVPWLPDTYAGGVACRVHFQFPFAVPFTEIQIRPFARYPVHALQVVWDNRRSQLGNLVTDATFASGATHWTLTAASGSSGEFLAEGGYGNRGRAHFTLGDGRGYVASERFALSDSSFAFHLHFKVYRDEDVTVRTLVQWYSSGAALLRADWIDVPAPVQDWFELSKLLIPPTDAVSGELSLLGDGTGDLDLCDVVLSPTLGVDNLDTAPELESGLLNLPLDGAVATDVWLVLAQPHYEFLQVAVPEGDLDREALWEETLLAAEASAERILLNPRDPWQLQPQPPVAAGRALPERNDPLLRQARLLGGRIRTLVQRFLRFARPSGVPVQLDRYLYILGAWELTIRHREYSPQGLWVSRPYRPRGEVREMRLLTTPSLSELTAGDPPAVRFWVTARAEDGTDKALPFTGRATFAAAHEEAPEQSETHFPLVPITQIEVIDGTDRLGKAALEFHPYVDRERISDLQARLTGGALEWPSSYDPNQELYHLYTAGTPADRAGKRAGNRTVTVEQVTGYRPVKVTLRFPNGRVALPDVLGRVRPGEIGFAGPELLLPTEVLEEFRSTSAPPPRSGLFSAPQATRQRERRQQVLSVALQTRFRNLVTSNAGAAFTLFWHKSTDIATGSVETSGNLITSGDILISPANYTVDAANGVVTVQATPPSGNAQYDSFVAYYHYLRDEVNGREEFDTTRTGALPTSGVDLEGTPVQGYPVTRNVTDYVNGDVRNLRPPNLDELDEGYYPVYEYFVDERGRLVFAQSFHPFSDTPAQLTVEYETLAVEPRLIVEFPRRASGGFSLRTPILNDCTVMLNARR